MSAGMLQSQARLAFGHNGARTVLTERRAGGLFHFSKPYHDTDADTLVLQLVNPTAGIFAGDSASLDLSLGPNTRVALEMPSATRLHAMGDHGSANLSQTFRIGSGASLDYCPEWLIPQSSSAATQRTHIDLQKGARLSFVDLIAPGRVAHGETHRYRAFTSEFQLDINGLPLARERMQLTPENRGWPLAVEGWKTTYYGALWLVDADLPDDLQVPLDPPLDPAAQIRGGGSLLAPGVYVYRVLAARSLLVKQALQQVRETLAAHTDLLTRKPRKL